MHPDLIMMDIGLPGIAGDEATACLKANPATQEIPVIINTAFATGPQTKRALDAGAAEILHKPFPLAMLCDVLSKYLSGEDERKVTVTNVKLSNYRSQTRAEKASPQAKSSL